jgi:sodium/potassium-transporting ATPase subunit alpha
MFVKGAPDVLLPHCTSAVLPSGEVRGMSQEILNEFQQLLSQWSIAGQRVLLLARRVLSATDVDAQRIRSGEISETALLEILVSDLVAVGMLGIVDPPRPEIPDVVQACRDGGIRVVMVTFSFWKINMIGHRRLWKNSRSNWKGCRNDHRTSWSAPFYTAPPSEQY